MNAASSSQSHNNAHDLAQRIAIVREELSIFNPTFASQLRKLGDDIESQSTRAWSRLDLTRMFDLDGAFDNYFPNLTRWLYPLEAIRNILILLPLIVTWYAIGNAANHYQALLQTQPDMAKQSFLVLWQTGFEGRTSLTLGDIAWWDVLLLGFVVMTTALVLSLQQSRNKQVSKLRTDLFNILFDATLEIATQDARRPIEVVARLGDESRLLAESIRNMKEWLDTQMAETKELADFIRQALEQEINELKAVSEKNRETASNLGQFTAQLQNTTITIRGAIIDLTHVIQEIPSISSNLAKSHHELANALQTIADDQKNAFGLLRQATNTMQDSAGILKITTENFGKGVKQLGQSSDILSESTKQVGSLGETIKIATTNLANISPVFDKSLSLLNDTIPANIRRQEVTADRLDTVNQQQEIAADKLEIASQQLKDASQSLEEAMRKLIAEMQTTLVAMREAKLRINSRV